jgi:hypothetical protein
MESIKSFVTVPEGNLIELNCGIEVKKLLCNVYKVKSVTIVS